LFDNAQRWKFHVKHSARTIDGAMSDDFKSRLERLHGARSRASERKEDEKAQGVYSADDAVEHDGPDSQTVDAEPSRPDGPTNRSGQPWLDEAHPPDTSYGRVSLQELLGRPPDRLFEAADMDADGVDGANWSDVAFLDIETTGLSDTDYAFCAGVGFWQDDTFLVRIYHMRDGDDDVAMLQALAEGLTDVRGLCTFNGASFDVPVLERQYEDAGLDSPLDDLFHLDLLPLSRQAWPDLDSHSMESLEKAKLDVARQDDVPGSEAPKRWDQFVRSGRFSVLSGVFEHNRRDILALVALACTLDAELGGPELQAGPVPDRTDQQETGEPDLPDFEPPPGESGGNEKARRGGEAEHDEPLPDDDSVTSRLTRQYALREKSRKPASTDTSAKNRPEKNTSKGKPKERTRRRSLSPDNEEETATAGPETSRQRPGERVATLREEAASVINAEGVEAAANLLHRIVALSPDHPWALERLVDLHQSRGENRLASHYRARLKKTSPF
jgi:uncharacterized protein YprB with RNaseH-like and TPR domain